MRLCSRESGCAPQLDRPDCRLCRAARAGRPGVTLESLAQRVSRASGACARVSASLLLLVCIVRDDRVYVIAVSLQDVKKGPKARQAPRGGAVLDGPIHGELAAGLRRGPGDAIVRVLPQPEGSVDDVAAAHARARQTRVRFGYRRLRVPPPWPGGRTPPPTGRRYDRNRLEGRWATNLVTNREESIYGLP
jgi:hypothetical protein